VAKPLLTHSFNCGFSGSGEGVESRESVCGVRRAERAERVCRESGELREQSRE
jgi:hypothetical protein